ncbi:hypothetical protein ABNX24_004386 [Escherichia albertii]
MSEKILIQSQNSVPVFFQEEKLNCAITCIKMIAHYYKLFVNTIDIMKFAPRKTGPYSFLDIITIFDKMGFYSCAFQLEHNEINKLRLPCIVYLTYGHFVVLVEIIEDKYIIHDPDIGAIEKSLEHFLDIFSGFAIIIG